MKLRSKRSTQSGGESPFLSQAESEPNGSGHNHRPRLRFDSSQKTEEWLASREKTDYTYSRSTSYTVTGVTSDYTVPIMSRVSQGAFLRDTSSPMGRGLLQQEAAAGSPNRRSSRLARKSTLNESSLLSRSSQSQTRSVQVNRNPSHTNTPLESHERFDEDVAVSGEESVWPSSAISSSASHFGRTKVTESTHYHQLSHHHHHHHRSGQHPINHMFGLDANEESEISDTESSSAVTSAVSGRSLGSYKSSDHSRTARHARSSSILFLPVSFLLTIVTSSVSVVTTVTSTIFSSLRRVVYGSSTGSASAMATSSSSTTAANVCSRFVQFASLAMYRCVTYLLCADVWWLVFTKRTTLGLVGFFGSLVGLSSARQGTSAAGAAAMSAALLEKRRQRRRSCCLCLLLLLGTIASSYLLMAAAPFLLAAVPRNKTEGVSPLRTINQQFGLLLGMLGSGEDRGDGGGAVLPSQAGAAATGCLQCLKKEDLAGLIGVAVGDQLSDLQSAIASQNQLILAMQQSRTEQETQIRNLKDQLGLMVAQQGQPGDRTLLHISGLEGQLARVRGQLRNLQLGRMRGQQRDEEAAAAVVTGFGEDVRALSAELAGLRADLADLAGRQELAADSARRAGDGARGDLEALGLAVAARQDGLAANVTFLEARLGGLARDVEALASGGRRSAAELEELVGRLDSFEAGLSEARTGVRSLESQFTDLLAAWERGKEAEAGAAASSLDLLRVELAALRESHGEAVASRGELQAMYQTLSGSLDRVRTDFAELRASVADLGTRQLGGVRTGAERLEARLGEIATEVSSLQADLLVLRDAAPGKSAEESGLDDLRSSVMQTEGRLGGLGADVDSLKLQVSQLRSRTEEARTSQEEHRAQAGQALRDLKADLGEVRLRAERMVSLESLQTGDAGSQLSEELGAVRLDVRLMGSLDGPSRLVAEVTDLRSSLTSAASQLSYFEMTQMQMTRTFTTSLSEVRDEVARLGRSTEDHGSAVAGLNASVASLQRGQERLSAFVTQKQLEDLRVELANAKAEVADLSAALSGFATSGDVGSLKTLIAAVQSRVDAAQLHLTELSDARLGEAAASYAALAARVTETQAAVEQLQAMLVDADHQPIDLVLLESRVGGLASQVDDNAGRLAGLLASGDAGLATGSSGEAIVGLLQDLAALRVDTDRLSGLLDRRGEEGGDGPPTAPFAALLDRTAALEASTAQLKASGHEATFQRLRGDMNDLREDMMRQEAQYHTGGGLGVLAGGLKDDMEQAKRNISLLQADVHKCCKNKTGLAGWWSLPWFNQRSQVSSGNLSVNGRIDEEAVRNIVLSALSMYNADKTGMVDYALESAGGSVVSTRCSETHYSKTALLSIFGIPLWYMANSPRTVIQPDIQPGNCWAFKGTQGYIVIKLAGVITPTAFSLEHIPKSLSPTGTIDSAPKEFSVWGVTDEDDAEAVLLGEYVYDQEGSPLQMFAIERADVEPIPAVELKIHSNHGNLEYTCLYRFRVHGTLDRR